jgi:ribosomal protein S18 acetylase RimI-like enzyme
MTDVVTAKPAVVIKYLLPDQDESAAVILAPATGAGTVERAREVIAAARTDPDTELFGLNIDGELAGVYLLHKVTLMNEITHLAIAEGFRRQGHGRACLYDALLRSGRRPLVVETDDDALGFYKRCGFKLVGKRKHPSGTIRYRLGWHAPLPQPVES